MYLNDFTDALNSPMMTYHTNGEFISNNHGATNV